MCQEAFRTSLRGERRLRFSDEETEAQAGSIALCLPLTSVRLLGPFLPRFTTGRPLELLPPLKVTPVKPVKGCIMISLSVCPLHFLCPPPLVPMTD